MVIKVRLIKRKIKHSQSFYRSSQIKFQSLSTPPLMNLRMRSTQKLIQLKSPWQQLSSHQIQTLAQRLQDRPQDLYNVVKETQKLRKQLIRVKFNKIDTNEDKSQNKDEFHKIQSKNQPSLTNFCKVQKMLGKDLGNINVTDKFSQNKLLNRINQKRLQYQKQLKSMIRDKRLILETDLPKINKIKAVHQPIITPLNTSTKLTLTTKQMR